MPVRTITGKAAGQNFLKPATTCWNRLYRFSAMNDLALLW